MDISVTGLSHKTAPVEIREKLNFPPETIAESLQALVRSKHVSEAVILSTCNRTEIYSLAKEPEVGKKAVVDFLLGYSGLKLKDLNDYLYFYNADHAIHHLFSVSASLDSMVLGEAQILGQVKEAYAFSESADCSGVIFHRLFRRAFTVGKRVRTETSIGESAVSVSYAAVQLAKKVFEDLTGHTCMILGAGEMSELTALHLVDQGVSSVLVTNRTFERAEKLANQFKGKAVKFDEMREEMVNADIVISSTAAPHYVVNKDDMKFVMKKRRNQPIFLIDISVPRDIDPDVNKLDNVYLYDIDDLQKVVESNKEERLKAAKIGEAIIEEEKSQFLHWISTLEVTPTIAELKEKADKIKEEELEKVISKLRDLSEGDLERIKALSNVIVNRILHEPIINLKELTKSKNGYVHIESLRFLFGLDEQKSESEKEKVEK